MSETTETTEPVVDTTEVAAKPPEKQVPVLTDDDRENFFKAFISDAPYEETLKLFNGKATVRLRTLTIDENDEVFRQISFDQANGTASNDDGYYVKIVQYRLAGSVISVDNKPFCEDITPESHPADSKTGKTYLIARLVEMQKWQTFKLGAITEAFNFFETKVRSLTADSIKGNF